MSDYRIITIILTTILLFQAGLFESSQVGEADNPNIVIVLADPSLFSNIEDNLNQYYDDLSILGYLPIIVTQQWDNPEEVRDYLAEQYPEGLVGIVIIGDIPTAWYENETEEFPIDLFYMDLDGIWLDTDYNDIYDTHSGNTNPEIWLGRITATTLNGDPADLTNGYLEKLHNFRIGEYIPNNQALLYIDDDWAYMASTWEDDLSYLYNDNITTINGPVQTNAQDYKDRLSEDFDWIQVAVHSYPTEHWFKVMEIYQSEKVTSNDIMEIGPKAFYYNLFACSAARYTSTDYIGGCYLFSDSRGVALIGSTKSGSMKEFKDFYEPLGYGKSLGSAFLEWFQKHGESEPDWYYGLTILGDPTLVPKDPHLPENIPPSIQITEPDGADDEADESYIIKWLDSDPDDDAQIYLYYDITNEGYDGILINQQPLSEDNDIDEFIWDTKDIIEGNYYIYASIIDSMNPPVYIYSDGQVTIDHPNILPIVEIKSPMGGTVFGTVKIQGTAQDPDSNNVESVYISIDDKEKWELATGTTSWSHPWDTTKHSDGEHIIYAKAFDGEDNSEIVSVIVTVDNGENKAPEVSITYPNNGTTIFDEIEISGTAYDCDGTVQLVEIQIDNYGWDDATGTLSWSWTWNTLDYTDGKHIVYVKAKDDIGEYSEIKSIILFIDNGGGNVPPVVNIISPTDGIVTGIVVISGTTFDFDGDETIAYVQVKIDNGDWEYTDGKIDWSYNWDTTTLDDGDYTVYVRAFDDIDYSMKKSVNVYVDNPHEPILTISSTLSETLSGTITIQGTASDIDGDIIKIEIQIDNGDWEKLKVTTNWKYKLDTTKLSDGKHTIKIRVIDDEGEYCIRTLTIDVNNLQDNGWWLFLLGIMIFTILALTVVILKKRRLESETRSIGQTHKGEGIHYEIQSLRCPRCENLFKAFISNSITQCPYCGLRGSIK